MGFYELKHMKGQETLNYCEQKHLQLIKRYMKKTRRFFWRSLHSKGFGKRREVGLWKEDNFSRKAVLKSTFSFKTVREGWGLDGLEWAAAQMTC